MTKRNASLVRLLSTPFVTMIAVGVTYFPIYREKRGHFGVGAPAGIGLHFPSNFDTRIFFNAIPGGRTGTCFSQETSCGEEKSESEGCLFNEFE